jgi:hypothetical protein
MNYQEPYKISDIDLDKLVYPKQKLYNNKKIILIKYNDQTKLKNFVFQTPTILNLYEPTHHENYSEIEIALHGKENNKVNYFIQFLNVLELKIKNDAKFYANEWFNFNEEKSIINFQKIIRDSDNHKNGTLKLKILKNNDFETSLQINNIKKININDIKKNTWCKMLLECYAVWINSNNDFGIYLRPILISFSIKEYNYNLIQDSEDEDDYNIPETEISNIFIKNKINKKNELDNMCTSQLEINELINKLETSDIHKLETSDIHKLETSEINKNNINTLLKSSDDDDDDDDDDEDNNINIELVNKTIKHESETSLDNDNNDNNDINNDNNQLFNLNNFSSSSSNSDN